MKSPVRTAVCAGFLFAVNATLAADKNGVSPQVISLPSGPGSVQGLGESFQPQLNSGSGTFSIAIRLPAGPAGFAPPLSIDYHTGQGNGPLGIGWKLSGATMVSRNIDQGLPFYVDGPNGIDDDFDGIIDNPQEVDRFSGVNLEELVPVADGSLRSENEGSFTRYLRVADGWTVQEKSGIRHEFGATSAARVESGGRIFAWMLQRTVDPNGNAAEYTYTSDVGSPGQKYLREVRWARPQASYAAVFSYDSPRPDVYADFRSGFEIRTAMRMARIDIVAQGVPPSPTALVGDFNNDGQPDSLIRRYDFEYETGALVSRLRRVTMFGADGVTSLPPITFEYTTWTPPHDTALFFTSSAGDPEDALDSDDVELIDMNQDGLPDLLNATQGFHRVHFNLGMDDVGRLAWDTAGALVGNAPGLNLAQTSVHLADHTADGQSDLIHKVDIATFQCYVNSGQGSWRTPVNLGNTDTWPQWPFENAGSRTLDTDHNRLQDVLFTGDNSYRLWMMMPGGRYSREVPLPVLSDGTQAFHFEDPGARIADVNGDRINDLVWIQSTRVVYWASCGRGMFEGPIVLPLSNPLLATEISQVDLADINGDALSDLVVVRPSVSPNGIHYFLNRGLAGFDVRRTILGLPTVVSGDTTRCADMNGNGSVDFLISNSARPQGNRVQFLDFVPGIRPNLLTRIDNGFGLVTTLEYETSVEQMIRARDAGNPWESTMPISVPVVSRITESDSRGNEFVRELTYRDPYYDSAKQEFRGFTLTAMREVGDDSAPTRITTTTFDPGIVGSCRKGMVLSREVTNEGGDRFERVENTLQHRIVNASPDGREVCFAFDEATDTYLIEQTQAPAHIRTEYAYDDVGNLLREDMHGLVGQTGDEVSIEKAYAYSPDIWLMDRPLRSTTRDSQKVMVAEDRYSYDDLGNLLDVRRWLNTDDRYIVTLRNEYDAFGNVIRVIDANDHSRSVAYDPLMHTYATAEIVHLETHNLTFSASYDLALGRPAMTADFAGAVSTFQYDPLGRLTALLRPGGALTTYEYALGSPVSRVSTRVRESLEDDDTFDRHDYFDGYGRALGSKIEAEDAQWRFVDGVTYNRRKLENLAWLPYFTSSHNYELPDVQMPHRVLDYDVQGRRVRMTNPDGTFSRSVYEPRVQHEHDENDTHGSAAPKTLRRDGLNRLVEVTERNGANLEYHTHYVWDALGNLMSMTDSQNNTKTIGYDSLRRSIALHDPDRGAVTYAYDDVGNLRRTTDARGRQILYSYDFANRLVSENYLDQGGSPDDPIDVRYVYDHTGDPVDFGDGQAGTASFTAGRLSSVVDLSGEEHRSYDARGNVVWTVKRIRDPLLGVLTPFKTGFTYDVMDRVTEVYYPDGDRCAYTYDAASFLESAGGGPAGQAIVTAAAYEPTGQLSQLTLGNGVSTTYLYDSRDRLAALRTVSPSAGDLINYAYTYDPDSNITRIDDHRSFGLVPPTSSRRNTQLFAYDALDRLTRVQYSPEGDGTPTLGEIDYAYDKIGNMISQSSPAAGQPGHIADPAVNAGTMTSGGAAGTQNRGGRLPGDPPGPHAVTATQAGGVFEYDDNGNMTGLDGATLTWDFKDRLVRFKKGNVDARYTYDYTGRRIIKHISQEKSTDQTLYVNSNFEYRPHRAPIKYVFAGSTRMAQIKGTLDPTRPRVQRFWLFQGWNLLTVAVQSLQTTEALFGAGSRAYEWTGSEYRRVPANALAPVGVPLWVEVDSPRVVAAQGSYDPPTLPVAIPVGQSLIAWTKLEPLVPAEHLLSIDGRIQTHDSRRAQWVTADPTLPPVVSDLLGSLPTSSAAWFTTETGSMLLPAAGDDRATVFYHGDHLGSAQVLTGNDGAVLLEHYYYPFGASRHTHQPVILVDPYGFTQKEKDRETGLHYFEARYLAAGFSRFATVDPKYANCGMLSADERAAYLLQPQKGNGYSYVLNNPLVYADPTGLDEDSQIANSILEGIANASEKSGMALEYVDDYRATQLAKHANIPADVARGITASKTAAALGKIATVTGVATNVIEGVAFVQDPTLEKGAHLGGTTAITVGGFVSGPGAAIAAGAQYTYDNTPQIHKLGNAAGDLETLRTGSRFAGGIEAAKVSVGLTLFKFAAGVGGGQAGWQGADALFDWILD